MPIAGTRRGRTPGTAARKLRSIVLIAALVWFLIPPQAAVAAPEPVNPQGKYLQVSVGELHSCAVTEGGDAGCWGQTNSYGAAPAKVVGPFRSISVGLDHTCAVRSDRSVACWGLNAEGQAPARVAGLFSSVSSGRTRSCALRTNGNMLCWSWDYWQDEPSQWEIPGPFLSMSLFDSDDTCAVRANGDATCWDSNGNGLSEQAGPFTMISAAFGRACALKTDGAIVCWIPGDTTGPPTTVAGPFTTLDVSPSQDCAIRVGGDLTCWNRDTPGEPSLSAPGPFDTVSVEGASCAVRTDHTMACWGDQAMMPVPPESPGPALTPVILGEAFEHSFYALPAASATYAVRGTLPTGVTLSPEGRLRGVPRRLGSFGFDLTASNLFGSATARFTMVVNRPNGVFDLNGDGLPDLAIGAPSEDVGAIADAGTVTVLYGAPDGTYGRAGSLAISQESVGQRSESGDRFGAAIVIAEVTGDAYVDLVIGAPGEDRGAGQVVVVHGSKAGITGTKRTVLQQGRAGAAGAAEAGDGFGSAISVGDALWIGAPGEDLGRATNAGTATVFQIKPVRTAGSIQHQQGARKIPGAPESGDRFGAALAGGGTLIGVPGEDIGRITDAGLVAWNLTHTLTQATSGVPGDPEPGDQFGASVAAAITDATDDEAATQPDAQVTPELLDIIAVGAPGEDVGTVKDAGAGTLILAKHRTSSIEVVNPVNAPIKQAGARFGASQVFVQPPPDDLWSEIGTQFHLAVGAPGQKVGSAASAGAVHVVPLHYQWGDPETDSVDLFGARTVAQGTNRVPGPARSGNGFGTTLSELPGIAGGILIGAPGQAVSGRATAGAVTVSNTEPIAAQLISQDSTGVAGTAEAGDRFATLPGR